MEQENRPLMQPVQAQAVGVVECPSCETWNIPAGPFPFQGVARHLRKVGPEVEY